MSGRFGTIALSEIDIAVNLNTPLNTKKSKTSVWKQFEQFCKVRSYCLDEKKTMLELNSILQDWAFNMKKQDGTDYKETVVKAMWNSTAKQIQENYFRKFNVKFNPFEDIEFKSSREAKSAKRKELQVQSDKRKSSAVAFTKEEFTKMVNVWDENTPKGLNIKFFLISSYELAWRGGEAAASFIHYFKEELDHTESFTGRIEYNPIFNKTSQGGDKKMSESKWLVSNTDDPDNCPVRLYKKLLNKRTKSITTKKLFLTPNPNWQNNTSSGWFKNIPVGRNTLSKWMSKSATSIGINTGSVKVTNHSARATLVSNLAKAGIGEEQLIKMSGHSSTHSIRPYLQIDVEHHEKIVKVMRETEVGADNKTPKSISLPSSSVISTPTISTPLVTPVPTSLGDNHETSSTKVQHLYTNCTITNNYYS